MVNRGYENTVYNVAKLKIIELLTALTAVKVHRPDLIKSPTVFRDLSPKLKRYSVKNQFSKGLGFAFARRYEPLIIYPKLSQPEFNPNRSF
ncbi:MAG: hypothetical protein ACTSYB_06810 [Candidatus Helarchaeota archaeon]